MARDWPQLKRRRRPRYGGLAWIGDVKPQMGQYTIEIFFAADFDFPWVRVVLPKLLRLPCNAEGALPHVYPHPDGPILCLFDPEQNEWNKGMLISRTTVPWTLDWIACYEWWTMTGAWPGGGRHAGDPLPSLQQKPKAAARK